MHDPSRRQWLTVAAAGVSVTMIATPALRAAEKDEKEREMEVSAVEDLMREHGVLRRALLVYAEVSARLMRGKTDVPLDALGRTAMLFRRFGEEYHERNLEEKHVFVPLIKAGGSNGALARTLTAQHERGRQITDYISAVVKKGRLAPASVTPFSTCLSDFVRMYEHHAAIEDTIIFPAWKASISPAQYDELNEEFEDLEHKMFGKDGFEDAVTQIAAIEQEFGLADLGALTAAAPPAV